MCYVFFTGSAFYTFQFAFLLSIFQSSWKIWLLELQWWMASMQNLVHYTVPSFARKSTIWNLWHSEKSLESLSVLASPICRNSSMTRKRVLALGVFASISRLVIILPISLSSICPLCSYFLSTLLYNPSITIVPLFLGKQICRMGPAGYEQLPYSVEGKTEKELVQNWGSFLESLPSMLAK